MSNVKPISDLISYHNVLADIAVGSPVFLTQNGRERYVIIEMAEYEKNRAEYKLLSELMKSEKTAEEKGWLTEEEADAAIEAL
jgi:PHD/YefM family antitoxin component YafN of YafNO toxin-antitoxin module